jgi:hypothetical protein
MEVHGNCVGLLELQVPISSQHISAINDRRWQSSLDPVKWSNHSMKHETTSEFNSSRWHKIVMPVVSRQLLLYSFLCPFTTG